MDVSQYIFETTIDGISRSIVNLPINTHRINYTRGNHFNAFKELVEKYQNSKDDIHHFTHPFMTIMSRFKPKNSIINIHDTIMDNFYHDDKNYAIRQLCRNFDAIVTVSKNAKKDIANTYNVNPKKIHVIPNFVDRSIFYPLDLEKPTNEINLLYVGSNFKHKNLQFIHEVINELKAHNYKVNFNHMGYGGKPATDTELNLHYNQAHFYISPSLYEGFNIPLIEAQACHCKIITSPLKVHHEILNKTSTILTLNVQKWSDFIIDHYTDQANINAYEANLKRFTIERHKQALLKLYRNLH